MRRRSWVDSQLAGAGICCENYIAGANATVAQVSICNVNNPAYSGPAANTQRWIERRHVEHFPSGGGGGLE